MRCLDSYQKLGLPITQCLVNNMRVKYKINSHEVFLEPYNSKKEKDLLILKTYEIFDLDEYLTLLGFYEINDIKKTDLTNNEKRIIIWKIRAISVGNEVDIRFTCNKCKYPNETFTKTEFFNAAELNDPDIKKLAYEVNDDSLHLFCDLTQDEIDDLDVLEYDELFERIYKNQNSFNFNSKVKCFNCGFEHYTEITDDFMLDVLSDETLETIYNTYSHLVNVGNYSKLDIDSMYPFERTIFVSLLHKLKGE